MTRRALAQPCDGGRPGARAPPRRAAPREPRGERPAGCAARAAPIRDGPVGGQGAAPASLAYWSGCARQDATLLRRGPRSRPAAAAPRPSMPAARHPGAPPGSCTTHRAIPAQPNSKPGLAPSHLALEAPAENICARDKDCPTTQTPRTPAPPASPPPARAAAGPQARRRPARARAALRPSALEQAGAARPNRNDPPPPAPHDVRWACVWRAPGARRRPSGRWCWRDISTGMHSRRGPAGAQVAVFGRGRPHYRAKPPPDIAAPGAPGAGRRRTRAAGARGPPRRARLFGGLVSGAGAPRPVQGLASAWAVQVSKFCAPIH